MVADGGDLPQLRFTEQVANGHAPLSTRMASARALADCEIGGYPIPAGTVIINPWVSHRDRAISSDHGFRLSAERLRPAAPRFATCRSVEGLCNRFAMMEAVILATGAALPIAMARRPSCRNRRLRCARRRRLDRGRRAVAAAQLTSQIIEPPSDAKNAAEANCSK